MNPQKNDDVPMKMLYAHANKFWLWPTLSVLPVFFSGGQLRVTQKPVWIKVGYRNHWTDSKNQLKTLWFSRSINSSGSSQPWPAAPDWRCHPPAREAPVLLVAPARGGNLEDPGDPPNLRNIHSFPRYCHMKCAHGGNQVGYSATSQEFDTADANGPFGWFTHSKWWFFIVTRNDQRVVILQYGNFKIITKIWKLQNHHFNQYSGYKVVPPTCNVLVYKAG